MALVLCSAGLIDGALYAMIDSLRKPPSFSGFIVGAQGQGMVGGSFLAFMFFRLRAAEKSMADWLLASSTQPHLPHGGFLDHEAPLPPRDASCNGRLVKEEAPRGEIGPDFRETGAGCADDRWKSLPTRRPEGLAGPDDGESGVKSTREPGRRKISHN
jgi:hypothetical protein